MCEVGAWKDFEDLETSLTLDELFILYEQSSERQTRLIEAVASSLGGGTTSSTGVQIDQSEGKIEYSGGEIVAPDKEGVAGGGQILFGYNKVDNFD